MPFTACLSSFPHPTVHLKPIACSGNPSNQPSPNRKTRSRYANRKGQAHPRPHQTQAIIKPGSCSKPRPKKLRHAPKGMPLILTSTNKEHSGRGRQRQSRPAHFDYEQPVKSSTGGVLVVVFAVRVTPVVLPVVIASPVEVVSSGLVQSTASGFEFTWNACASAV